MAFALIALSAAFAIIGAIVMEPAFLVIAVVPAALAALALWRDHWWATAPGVVGGVAAAVHLVVIASLFKRFDSGVEFGLATANLVFAAGILGFGIADLVERRRKHATAVAPLWVRSFAGSVAAVVAISAAAGIATVVQRDTVSAQDRAGAIEVTYADFAIEQKTLTVRAGETLKIVVENEDLAYHNFVIDDLNVKTGLGPGESKLVTLTVDTPGVYQYRCAVSGHSSMKGTLIVN